MRYLPTSKLTPGMALGQDIYDGAGRLYQGDVGIVIQNTKKLYGIVEGI